MLAQPAAVGRAIKPGLELPAAAMFSAGQGTRPRPKESKIMQKKVKMVLGSTLLAAMTAAPLMAHAAPRDQINARIFNMQSRINAGIRDGSLTPREAARLRYQVGTVRHNERIFLSKGFLTPSEHRMLNRQLDNVNRNVYVYRHNPNRRYGMYRHGYYGHRYYGDRDYRYHRYGDRD